MPRVTARKYQGDDRASWAVFIDGRPFVTGLTKPEVPGYKKQAEAILQRRFDEGIMRNPNITEE